MARRGYKNMTARYSGTCKGCGGDIKPGDRIAWGGRGRTYHEGCKPSDDSRADQEYWGGRARGNLRSIERQIYGDALVEQWDMEEDMFRYNHGLD